MLVKGMCVVLNNYNVSYLLNENINFVKFYKSTSLFSKCRHSCPEEYSETYVISKKQYAASNISLSFLYYNIMLSLCM